MNKIKKTILFTFGLALTVFVITWVINMPLFDETLLPEVQAIKNIKAKPYSEKNAYPALLAIHNKGDDLLSETTKIRHLLNKKIEDKGLDFFDNEEYSQYVMKGLDKEWQTDNSSCQTRRESDCMAVFIEQLTSSQLQNQRLSNQLNKYHQLIKMTDFSDPVHMDLDAPFLSWSPIMALQKFYLAQSYLESDMGAFIETAQQDQQFYRMLLDESHLLITKMVSVALIRNNLTAVSYALKQKQLSETELQLLQNKTLPIGGKGTDITQIFEFEFKYGMNFFEDEALKEDLKVFGLFDFFQPNATHNAAFKVIKVPMEKLSNLDAPDFYNLIQSGDHIKEGKVFPTWSPATLYNPVGKSFLTYNLPAYTDYLARIHDLNGMINLLKLQIELALNTGHPKTEVIAQSKYVNPYTLEPMNYNEETNRIYFQCMDKSSVCELTL
jgi:hypothetical protein